MTKKKLIKFLKGVRTVYLDENGNEVVKINGHICKLSDFIGKVELF